MPVNYAQLARVAYLLCKTQEFVVVFPPTVVTIVLNATTIAAVVSTLGRFLHAEVSEL